MSDALEARLAEYEVQLAGLRVENEQLRRSAQAFGELAERLNQALSVATAPADAPWRQPICWCSRSAVRN